MTTKTATIQTETTITTAEPADLTHWSDLVVLDETARDEVSEEDRLAALSEFRKTGGMDRRFFPRMEGQREDRPEEWGPGVDDVDWTGFPGTWQCTRLIWHRRGDGGWQAIAHGYIIGGDERTIVPIGSVGEVTANGDSETCEIEGDTVLMPVGTIAEIERRTSDATRCCTGCGDAYPASTMTHHGCEAYCPGCEAAPSEKQP